MHSCLESFSTELFFETFEYLSLIDRFRAFTGLNRRLTGIVNLYPVRVNLQSISRLDFDFLCHHIRPERVISLVFSEEKMPDQVKLFLEHFPDFEHQFIYLQSVNLIRTENCLSILPQCVSCLTFSKMFCDNGVNEMLVQQAKVLTHLNVDKWRLIQSVNIEFPLLTHLTIDLFCFIDQVDQVIQNFKTPPISSLNVSLAGDHGHFPSKFEKICRSLIYLKHLTIKLGTEIIMSFGSLEQCLNNLQQLTHLTIDATGTFDLLDGTRWEQFLLKRRLVKFNFKLSLSLNLVCNQSECSLLKPFRSPFWLEEKRWFVACHKNEGGHLCPSIYSVPYFIPYSLQCSTKAYPPLSTVPPNLEKQVFYDSKIDSYWYSLSERRESQKYPFSKVNSLHLSQNYPEFNYDILTSIVDLSHIRSLDLSSVQQISSINLSNLLEHTHSLEHLVIRQSDQSLILPSHIRSLYLRRNLSHDDISSEYIDKLKHDLSHIRHLEIKVQSTATMIEIIDRFDQLESIIFHWINLSLKERISAQWFRQNTQRLKKNNFTYRIGRYFERFPFGRQLGCGYRPPKEIIYLSMATNVTQLSEVEENGFSFRQFMVILWRQMSNMLFRSDQK